MEQLRELGDVRMKKKLKVIVVLPAYNAGKTLVKTIRDIPPHIVDKIILVDDASSDNTIEVAKKQGIEVFSHPINRGYGGNQKTCYTVALSEGADVVVMLHPDYQYDSSLIGELIAPILSGEKDVMLGSRITTRAEALKGGMPKYKYFGNRMLTLIENILLGQNLSEYHTGFRAFHRKMLEQIPFHKYSDDFVFDQQIIFGAIGRGGRIGEIKVPVRYLEDSSSINFIRSCVYGLSTLVSLLSFVFLGKE